MTLLPANYASYRGLKSAILVLSRSKTLI